MALRVCTKEINLANKTLRLGDCFNYETKRSCEGQTHSFKKMAYHVDENEIENDFALIGKNNRNYSKDERAISWELKHLLVKTNVNKVELKKLVNNKWTNY